MKWVAVIGAGYFGRFHYDAWSRMPETTLVAVLDRDAKVAQSVAAKYGVSATYDDLTHFAITLNQAGQVSRSSRRREAEKPASTLSQSALAMMLAEARLDIVDITSPPETHLDMNRTILRSGAAIQCQKPFCDTLDAACEAVEFAQVQGGILAVHENFRFQPWHRVVKSLLDEGALGDVYQATLRLRPGDGQGADAYLNRQPYFQNMPRFLVHEPLFTN